MMSGDIITLDDDKRYLLIEEYEYNNCRYFLAVGLLNGTYDKNDFQFFIDDSEDGEEYVVLEDDPDILKELFLLVGFDVAHDIDPNVIGKIDELMNYHDDEDGV